MSLNKQRLNAYLKNVHYMLTFFPSFLGWSGTESTNIEATTGLLYQPPMIMDDNECGVIGGMVSRGILGETLPQCSFVQHKYHMT
jgi:hypothetical protein